MALKADNSQASLSIIVDGITSPVAGDVQVAELATVAAGVATPVTAAAPLPVAAQPAGGYVDENGNRLTIKQAFVNISSGATDATVVAAVASKVIRVLAIAFLCGGAATNVTFNTKPAGAGTAISPLFQNNANGGAVLPFNPGGWLKTNSGEGLSATTSASGVSTGVLVTYVEV